MHVAAFISTLLPGNAKFCQIRIHVKICCFGTPGLIMSWILTRKGNRPGDWIEREWECGARAAVCGVLVGWLCASLAIWAEDESVLIAHVWRPSTTGGFSLPAADFTAARRPALPATRTREDRKVPSDKASLHL